MSDNEREELSLTAQGKAVAQLLDKGVELDDAIDITSLFWANVRREIASNVLSLAVLHFTNAMDDGLDVDLDYYNNLVVTILREMTGAEDD